MLSKRTNGTSGPGSSMASPSVGERTGHLLTCPSRQVGSEMAWETSLRGTMGSMG